jgi:uncharacterized protein (TIGR00730 family)
MDSLVKQIKVKKLELKQELNKKNHFRVAIFGSARVKEGDKVYQQVYDLAERIGKAGYDVVTGGGPGLMEAANSGHIAGDKEGKAESIGLIIHLPFENKGNPYLETSHRYRHFSTRLDTFLALSDVMVVTKGGIGSLLELFYMWQHLQVHHVEYKPIILIGEMWEQLVDWMKKEVLPENLVSPEDFDFVYIAKDNKEAFEMISKFHDLHKKEKKLRKIDCKGARCVIPKKPKAAKKNVVNMKIFKFVPAKTGKVKIFRKA